MENSNTDTVPRSRSHMPVNRDYLPQHEQLYKAVRTGNLDATEKFLTKCSEEVRAEMVRAKITPYDETALHVAVMFGRLHTIKLLVQFMSEKDLELVDKYGSTALHNATSDINNLEVIKLMVEKNKNLVKLPERNDWIPVTLALEFGNFEIARYLYDVTPLEVLLCGNGYHGVTLLRQCYYNKMFDVGHDLLCHCKTLAVTLSPVPKQKAEMPSQQCSEPETTKEKAETPSQEHPQTITFMEVLATVRPTILNESQLPCWKRWMYKWVHVLQQPASLITDELVHKQSHDIMRAACDMISTLTDDELSEHGVYSCVIRAAEEGVSEFIKEAIKVRLSLLWTRTANGGRIFHVAVQFRQARVYNLIHGVIEKNRFTNFTDNDGNTLLHMAGMLAPSTYLDNIPGAVLQVQRELQWFKEVESIMPPMRKEWFNNDKMTPRQVFTKNHKDLVKEGQRWTKQTASSCSFAAALVATITFAAAFTVPGGNNQSTGYPIFLQEALFMVFIITDAISLFSSSISILIFLGLLTSRYAEDDFLRSIPKKLIIGLSTLFISLVTMMIAFCVVLFLMLHDKLGIVIPVTLLAFPPIILYIWLQFPLLVEIFMSTYGPSIFDRNVKPWP